MSAKSVIGLEIGSANIRMVQLSGRSSGQVQLEKYAIEPLPQKCGFRQRDCQLM